MRVASRLLTLSGLAMAAAMALLTMAPRAAQATPIACSPCLYYGGDLNTASSDANGLINEDISGTQATEYAAFTVPTGQIWNITGLFGNNFMSFTAQTAAWSIRSGMSDGNGGTTLFSGSVTPQVTDTGVNDFGYEIYTVAVNGLSGIQLGAGTYWLSVVPTCPSCGGASYLANTDGSNAYGTAGPANVNWLDWAAQGYNYVNANTQGVFPTFSAGVIGTLASSVPEPSALGVFGLGLVLAGAFAGLRRRRLVGIV